MKYRQATTARTRTHSYNVLVEVVTGQATGQATTSDAEERKITPCMRAIL